MRDKSVETRPTMIYRRAFCKQFVPGIENMHGVEIGAAAHHDWMLDTINVDLEHEPHNFQFKRLGHACKVDIIASGEDMPMIETSSTDFVLASHVIEHIPNPIKAFVEWNRIIKSGGYVILAVPEKTRMYDSDKKLTDLRETVELFNGKAETATAERAGEHRNFWTMREFLNIVPWCRGQDLLNWDVCGCIDIITVGIGIEGNEFLVAYRVKK